MKGKVSNKPTVEVVHTSSAKAMKVKKKKVKISTTNEEVNQTTTASQIKQKTRDFSKDLNDYIREWMARDTNDSGLEASWKFNKIIQTWAINNCFDKNKVDSDLFKLWLPYAKTIQGSARERLVELAKEALTVSSERESGIENNNTSSVKRAQRIMKAFS